MSAAAAAGPGRVVAWLGRQVQRALDGVDLTLAQYRVLILLTEAAEGNLPALALADQLAVSRPSVTAVVDGLVARGLVLRHPDAGDRRRTRHVVTTRGRRALARGDAAVAERLVEITAQVDRRTAASALDGLQRWGPVLDAYRAAQTASTG